MVLWDSCRFYCREGEDVALQRLDVFIYITGRLDVAGTTRRLFVTRPTIDAAVSRVRGGCGVGLFRHVGGELFLASRNGSLLVGTRAMLSTFSSFSRSTTGSSGGPLLGVNSSLAVNGRGVPSLLNRLGSGFPCVSFRVSVGRASVVRDGVLGNALSFTFVRKRPSSLDVGSQLMRYGALIMTYKRGCGVPSMVALGRLYRCSLLLHRSRNMSHRFLSRVFTERGVVMGPIVRSVDGRTLVSTTAQGLNIAVLPRSLILQRLGGNRLEGVAISSCRFAQGSCLVCRGSGDFNSIGGSVFSFYCGGCGLG